MRAQPADHLSAETFDPHQLVDRPERAPLSVRQYGDRFGRSDSGQQRQHLRGRGVEVDDPLDGLARSRERGAQHQEQAYQRRTDQSGAGTHDGLSAPAPARLPGRFPDYPNYPDYGPGEQNAVWVHGVADSATAPAVPVGRQTYPLRQSLLLPQTKAQNRISLERGAHTP